MADNAIPEMLRNMLVGSSADDPATVGFGRRLLKNKMGGRFPYDILPQRSSSRVASDMADDQRWSRNISDAVPRRSE